jgi:hypothetical protein
MTRFLKLVEATMRGAPTPVLAVTDGADRRRRPRLVHRRAVDVRLPGQVQIAAAFTVDVSEGGVCVDLGIPVPELPLDTPVSLAWRTADGRDVRLDGRVRYARGSRLGLQFLPLDNAGENAVKALLAEAGGVGLTVRPY